MTGTENSKERIDDIGFSGFRLVQRPEWFCYGIDAVLAADFARVKEGGVVADLGCGTGIIPLVLMHKYSPAKVFGVEVQPEVAALARKTVGLNGLEDRIEIVEAEAAEAPDKIAGLGFEKGSLDAVVTNPPYVGGGEGLLSKNRHKAIARHEVVGCLEDFIRSGAELLRDEGDFYMINRPSRLVDVVFLCRTFRLEPKELRFVQPSEGKKPNIFLIHCVKNGRPELKFSDPLCVYGPDGKYSEEVMKIYERKER